MDDAEGMGLRSYQALVNALTESMTGPHRPLVKTWPVEVATSIVDVVGVVRDGLKRITRATVLVEPFVEAPRVLYVRVGATVEFFVDSTETRLWQIHSMSRTDRVERLLGRLVAGEPGLSFPALPEQLLMEASDSGAFMGFGLQHNLQFLTGDPDAGDSATVRVQSKAANKALEELRETDAFGSGVLDSVKVRNPYPGLGAMNYGTITATLSASGRVASRGNSFEKHSAFVATWVHRYRSLRSAIERSGAVGRLGDPVNPLRGPVELRFTVPIPNLLGYCERAMTGGEPFHIWGYLEQQADGAILMRCFDRESMARFSIEATPLVWRVYLPDSSPGSIVLRLWSRLQRHHHRDVELVGVDLTSDRSSGTSSARRG